MSFGILYTTINIIKSMKNIYISMMISNDFLSLDVFNY